MREIHIIATNDDPYGWYADSPQLPGFIMGRMTRAELAKDLPVVLGDLVEQPFRVIAHRQGRIARDGMPDVLIRAQEGETIDVRSAALRHVEQIAVDETVRPGFFEDASPNILGDFVVIGVAPEDTIGLVTAQMSSDDDVVILVSMIEPNVMWSTQFAVSTPANHPDWRSIESYGWSDDTTFRDVMDTLEAADERPGLHRLLVGV